MVKTHTWSRNSANRAGMSTLISAFLVLAGMVASPAQADGDCWNVTHNEVFATITDAGACSGAITTLPSSVTIGDVTYPVHEIGDGAFFGSTITSVLIPASVTSINVNAFSNIETLTAVSFGASSQLTTIGQSAFSGAFNLATFNLASLLNLETIGSYAFNNTDLRSVTIPASVTEIGTSAFSAISRLATLRFASGSTLTTIPDSFATSSGTILATGVYMSVRLPNSVTTIGAGAFRSANIRTIALPASLTSIGENAFKDAIRLDFVTLPDQLETIGASAFQGTSLEYIEFPESLTDIQNYAFYEVTSLTDLTFPDFGDITIGAQAFKGTSLGGDGLGNLGTGTLNLTSAISVIGVGAFQYIPTLHTINFPESGTIEILDDAFLGNDIGGDGYGGVGNGLVIPESVISIDAGAFADNFYLSEVTIEGDVLTELPYRVFANCALTSFEFPASIQIVDPQAFAGCTELEEYSVAGGSNYLEVDDAGVLFNKGKSTLISYPNARADDYVIPTVTEIEPWAFARSEVQAVTFAPGSAITEIPDNVFRFSKISSIVMPASVVSVGTNAFNESFLASLTFTSGSQLQTIGIDAFAFSRIENVVLPRSLVSIGNYAFTFTPLQEVRFESNSELTFIGTGAFYGAALPSFIVPAKVTNIGSYAFGYSDGPLSSIQLDGAAPVFGEEAVLGTNPINVLYYPSKAGWSAIFSGPLAGFTPVPMAAPVYTSTGALTTRVQALGTARVKKVLRAQTGTWRSSFSTTLSYRWYACSKRVKSAKSTLAKSAKCKAISGATGSTYTLKSKQKRKYVLVSITATNQYGSTKIYGASTGRVK